MKVGAPQALDAAKSGTKLSRGANFRCLMSGTRDRRATTSRTEGQAGRMGARLMAIVAEGDRTPRLPGAFRLNTKKEPRGA